MAEPSQWRPGTASLWLFLLSLFLSACHSKSHQPIAAFYHWKKHLQLTDQERLYLDSLNVRLLYVRFFDVDWDESARQPVPLSIVEIDTSTIYRLEIVPVVFITNRTLLNIDMEGVSQLSDRIAQKIESLLALYSLEVPGAFQFDCDWTGQTRQKYFTLLEHLRSRLGCRPPCSLSATIRLHQLRYPEQTGVPPIDRGMLMFYNMGDLEAWDSDNSILDLQEAGRYLDGTSYPLPLDLALPLFRWGVLFRDGHFIKLINGLTESDLQDSLRFAKIAPDRFEVQKSTYLQGHYLYQGDRLRLEAARQDVLEAAAGLLHRKLLSRIRDAGCPTVAFYHLDTSILKVFPHEKLEKIRSIF